MIVSPQQTRQRNCSRTLIGSIAASSACTIIVTVNTPVVVVVPSREQRRWIECIYVYHDAPHSLDQGWLPHFQKKKKKPDASAGRFSSVFRASNRLELGLQQRAKTNALYSHAANNNNNNGRMVQICALKKSTILGPTVVVDFALLAPAS
jgi:hypothetical protein